MQVRRSSSLVAMMCALVACRAAPPESSANSATSRSSNGGCVFALHSVPAPRATLERRVVAIPACTTPMTFVRVDAPKPFWIATTEVTWEQFDAYVYKRDEAEHATTANVDAITRPSQPYNPMDRGFGHAGFPALSMSFANAKSFCAWLSAHTGKRFRLPTESEWELAARAGQTADWIGGWSYGLDAFAWTASNAGGTTHAVGSKEPNGLGLLDVIGNAGEWCVAEDGTGVLRGGSYASDANAARFDARQPDTPAWNRHDPQVPKSKWWLIDGPFVGMRVVCDDEPASAR